jgi:hypothetical protein
VITMFSLSFTLLFSVLRIFEPVSCSFKARVSLASIHGHPLLLLLSGHLLPSLVKKSPWISGISSLVILLLQSSTKLSRQINCPCLHQSPPPSALHVNMAKVTNFISVIHLLFQILSFNCCFLMYESYNVEVFLS